jgi:hypothetical protein
VLPWSWCLKASDLYFTFNLKIILFVTSTRSLFRKNEPVKESPEYVSLRYGIEVTLTFTTKHTYDIYEYATAIIHYSLFSSVVLQQ